MSTRSEPRNRRERRAAAAAKSSVLIPLVQPDRSAPTIKTLLEIAAERQADLAGGQPFPKSSALDSSVSPEIVTTRINPDGSIETVKDDGQVVDPGISEDRLEDPVGPFGQAVFYSSTLMMLHFTLDVLVHQQYRQEIDWSLILRRTGMAFPLLIVLVYMLHPRAARPWAQGLFLAMSVGAGCYMVYSSNEAAYFAVMKRAPPLGTLWVWSVVEMRIELGVIGLAAVGAYFWSTGYTIFS